LIAEDDPASQMMMVKLLEKMGFHADIAANGLEAVQALQKRYYDLIFMDVQMPEMDGLQAARAIRELWPHMHTRIIALTGCTRNGDKEMCLAAGMDGYIAKPAKREDILRSLQRHDHHACKILL